MKDIKFVDLLKFSNEEFKKIKLIFNSDWPYDPSDRPEYVKKKLGHEKRHFDLLELYKQGEVRLVQDSTKTHDPKQKRFSKNELVFCFIPYDNKDWLFVNAFKVLEDNKKLVNADEKAMENYSQYFGRLVITWENRKTRNIRMKNLEKIKELTVKTILEKPYNETVIEFPGYGNIDLSWKDLRRMLALENWRAALENQNGIYLITDTKTNRRYVGSAYGEKGLYGRWLNYVETRHGNNKELKKLSKDYIEENFRYTILETFKMSDDENTVREREAWWKKVLLTYRKEYPEFGYNDNLDVQ